MHWQSWGFSLGALVFIFALIPMVRQREKPPLSASIPTAVVLFIFVGLFASLGGLDTAAITDLVTGGLWGTLAIQRWRMNRHAKPPIPPEAGKRLEEFASCAVDVKGTA